ncbi:hypothetical protein BXZ70DRAFT_911726, partial [Cristinia sonorae]
MNLVVFCNEDRTDIRRVYQESLAGLVWTSLLLKEVCREIRSGCESDVLSRWAVVEEKCKGDIVAMMKLVAEGKDGSGVRRVVIGLGRPYEIVMIGGGQQEWEAFEASLSLSRWNLKKSHRPSDTRSRIEMAWLSADEQTVKNRNEMMWVQSVFGTAKRRVDELQIDPKMLQVQICSPSQLETYEDLAVDEFTRNTDGFFPADHTKGQWQNGLKTFDPVSVTNHDRTDVEVIRWVQRHAFDATALLSNGTRLAEVLDYPDTSTISAVNEVVKKVHKHMSL